MRAEDLAQSRSLSGEEYQVLVEQSPVLIWRANLTSECDYFNTRWLEFRGRTLQQEVGVGWTEGVHRADYDRCVQTYTSAFAKRESFQMEYRILRYDGVYRWILDRGSPFYVDGAFAGYIGSCVDVTDRIEAQEAVIRKRVAELKQIHAMLPICSHCRQIRDENGSWRSLEDYISERSMTEFSHGVCPQCLAGLTKPPLRS